MKVSAKKGIDGLIGNKKSRKKKSTLSKEASKEDSASLEEAPKEKRYVERGLPEGYTRATFILKKVKLEELKIYSWFVRVPIKDVITEALDEYTTNKDRSQKIKKALKLIQENEAKK